MFELKSITALLMAWCGCMESVHTVPPTPRTPPRITWGPSPPSPSVSWSSSSSSLRLPLRPALELGVAREEELVHQLRAFNAHLVPHHPSEQHPHEKSFDAQS